MTLRFPWGPPLSQEVPSVASLEPGDARDIRLPWLSRFDTRTLQAHLQSYPHTSLWVPETGEYAIMGRWRRRHDIAEVVEVTARKGRQALLQATVSNLQELGFTLVLLSDELWRQSTKTWQELGFSHLERIVLFQKDLRSGSSPYSATDLPTLRYTPFDPSELDTLTAVDHHSFPWLWWNSAEEFSYYLGLDGVYLYLAWMEDQPVGYVSFTMYNGWAHLDRIAVVAGKQGRGYGAALLTYTLDTMRDLGATSVGLSTQENNLKSHRLYKTFGFKQLRDTMNFYGLRLRGEAPA